MDNKILTEEAKETEKEAGKEVENGVSASDEAIKAVEAMKAAASAQQAEEDAVYIEPGMAWRAWKSQCCCSSCHCKRKGKV